MYQPENTVLINTKKSETMTEKDRVVSILFISNSVYIPACFAGCFVVSPVSII